MKRIIGIGLITAALTSGCGFFGFGDPSKRSVGEGSAAMTGSGLSVLNTTGANPTITGTFYVVESLTSSSTQNTKFLYVKDPVDGVHKTGDWCQYKIFQGTELLQTLNGIVFQDGISGYCASLSDFTANVQIQLIFNDGRHYQVETVEYSGEQTAPSVFNVHLQFTPPDPAVPGSGYTVAFTFSVFQGHEFIGPTVLGFNPYGYIDISTVPSSVGAGYDSVNQWFKFSNNDSVYILERFMETSSFHPDLIKADNWKNELKFQLNEYFKKEDNDRNLLLVEAHPFKVNFSLSEVFDVTVDD